MATRRQDPTVALAELQMTHRDLERRHGVELEAHQATRQVAELLHRRVDALIDLVGWMTGEHPLGQMQVTLDVTSQRDLDRVSLLTEVLTDRAEVVS